MLVVAVLVYFIHCEGVSLDNFKIHCRGVLVIFNQAPWDSSFRHPPLPNNITVW